MECILNASLLLLHFNFGGCTDVDLRNAASQLRQTLLELLAVVIAGGAFDLALDLLNATLDVLGLAAAINDGGEVLADRQLLGLAELLQLNVLQVDSQLFHDRFAAGEDCEVFQH